jgi:hypothetical protein
MKALLAVHGLANGIRKIEGLDIFVCVDKQRQLPRLGPGSSSCIRPDERHKPTSTRCAVFYRAPIFARSAR